MPEAGKSGDPLEKKRGIPHWQEWIGSADLLNTT
jgi:hypothetical protein